jgi:cell division protein FtsA
VKRNIVTIDIGTYKVCALICRYDTVSDSMEVAGKGVWPSAGIRKGMIVNTYECSDSIRNAIELAQDDAGAGTAVRSAYVNIIGMNVYVIDKKYEMQIASEDGSVTREDIIGLLSMAKNLAVCKDEQIIDVIPRQYFVNEVKIQGNPEGRKAKTLGMESQIAVARIAPVQRIMRCIADLGIELDGFIVEALALPELVLTNSEKSGGALIIDVGGMVTDISFFKNGRLYFNDSIPVGGHHLANDLAIGLELPFQTAENFIRQNTIPSLSEINEDETVSITTDDGEEKSFGITSASEIIEARVLEILSLSSAMIDKNNINPAEDSSILVISGKGLIGIGAVPEYARRIFGLPLKLVSEIKDDEYDSDTVTAYSMAKYIPMKYKWDNYDSKVEG